MVSVSAPEHLGDAARGVWDEMTAAHPSPERIAGADLEAYCVQVARMRDAQGRIDAEGLVIADAKGNPVPHPAIALEKAAHAEIRAWGDRFKPPRRRAV